jgi:hypothetical protein
MKILLIPVYDCLCCEAGKGLQLSTVAIGHEMPPVSRCSVVEMIVDFDLMIFDIENFHVNRLFFVLIFLTELVIDFIFLKPIAREVVDILIGS